MYINIAKEYKPSVYIILGTYNEIVKFCLFVLEFYGPVNNEAMSSRSVNSGTVPGQT